MINPKKFAIYCSGNASRVIRFYTDTYNLETFFPNLVIYDGDSKDTLSTLLKIFQERLKYINFDLLNDEEKRKKLVIYINPPYAEAGTTRQRTGTGINKENVSKGNKTHTKYKPIIKQAANEIFALFLIRIYKEIPLCKIAEFSKLKILQSSNFSYFRNEYRAKLDKIFIVPANTFDKIISSAYIYEKGEIKRDIDEIFILPKSYITKWIKKGNQKENIGMMNSGRTDFQNQNLVHIQNETNDKSHSIYIDKNNLILTSLFFAMSINAP